MLDQRKQQFLGLVVEHYIESMQPVGSRFLRGLKNVTVSEATIRNDLRALEDEGFLTHPHTSAGRVPTEQGYRFYVDHVMKKHDLAKETVAQIQTLAANTTEKEQAIKQLAKYVALYSGNAVIVAFSKNKMYYTGMSYLFSQPEFQDYARTVQVSGIFDHCEERLHLVYNSIEKTGCNVLIGQQNPLGGACSMVAATIKNDMLFMLLGPMRMKYKQNTSIMQFLHTHI